LKGLTKTSWQKEGRLSALKKLNSDHNVVIVYDASGSMTAKLPMNELEAK